MSAAVDAQSLDHDRCYSTVLALEYRLGSCRRLVRQDPRDVRSRLALGWALFESGDLTTALREFTALQEFDKRNARVALAVGITSRQLGDTTTAQQALRMATKLEPALTDAWRQLSLVAAELGRIDEAFDVLARGLAVNPSAPELHFERGLLLSQVDSAESALRSFAAAARLWTENVEYWGALAVVSCE